MPKIQSINHPMMNQLPAQYLIALTGLSAITVAGVDQKSYLQGQLTCDVNSMSPDALINGAHCDAKGKVFSVFRLLNKDQKQWLIQPEQTVSASLAALQKFGVFAKVTIEKNQQNSMFALVSDQAQALLKTTYGVVPDNMTPVVHYDQCTIAYIAGQIDRYLIICPTERLNDEMAKFALPVLSFDVWQLHEMREGFPILPENGIGEYVPQMLNVNFINGISFTKGCYLGQETVARMQYLGKNKRALFCLKGEVNNIDVNDIIEYPIGEQWKRAGTVLAFYKDSDANVFIQAVLSNDIQENATLRLKQDESSQLTIQPLPYSTTTQENL